MYGGAGREKEIGYRIEVTLLGGTLRLEESGKVAADYKVSEEEIRKAEQDVRRSLEKVYGLVMQKVGSQVVQTAVAKAFAEGAGVKQELAEQDWDFEGRWMVTVTEAAKLLGVGRSKMYELVRTGQVPSVTLGSSRRIPLKGLREWIEAQTREGRRW